MGPKGSQGLKVKLSNKSNKNRLNILSFIFPSKRAHRNNHDLLMLKGVRSSLF